jgi:hypothetical protein
MQTMIAIIRAKSVAPGNTGRPLVQPHLLDFLVEALPSPW